MSKTYIPVTSDIIDAMFKRPSPKEKLVVAHFKNGHEPVEYSRHMLKDLLTDRDIDFVADAETGETLGLKAEQINARDIVFNGKRYRFIGKISSRTIAGGDIEYEAIALSPDDNPKKGVFQNIYKLRWYVTEKQMDQYSAESERVGRSLDDFDALYDWESPDEIEVCDGCYDPVNDEYPNA